KIQHMGRVEAEGDKLDQADEAAEADDSEGAECAYDERDQHQEELVVLDGPAEPDHPAEKRTAVRHRLNCSASSRPRGARRQDRLVRQLPRWAHSDPPTR